MKFRHGALTGSLNPDAGGGIYFTREDGAPVAALAMYYAVNEAKAVKVWPGEGFGRIIALDLKDAIPAYEQYKLSSEDFTKGGAVFKLKVGDTWYERSANKRQIEYDIVSRQLVFTDNMGPLADMILRGQSLQFCLEIAGWTQVFTPPKNEVYKEQTWVGTFSAISTVDLYLGADWTGDTRCAACVEFFPDDHYGEVVAWAKAINAHADAKKLVTAEAFGDMVKLEAVKKGAEGNSITLAVNDKSVELTETHLTGGADVGEESDTANMTIWVAWGASGMYAFALSGITYRMELIGNYDKRLEGETDAEFAARVAADRAADDAEIARVADEINANERLYRAAVHRLNNRADRINIFAVTPGTWGNDLEVTFISGSDWYYGYLGGSGNFGPVSSGTYRLKEGTDKADKATGYMRVLPNVKPEANASVTIGGHKVLRYGKASGRELVSVQGQDSISVGKKSGSYNQWGEEKTIEGEMRGGAVSLVGGRDKAIVRVTHPRNSTWFTRRVANIYIRS